MKDQKQRAVLEYLQQGGSLTVLECISRFHTTELRRIVTRLKGYGIKSELVEGANYHRYFIPTQTAPVVELAGGS